MIFNCLMLTYKHKHLYTLVENFEVQLLQCAACKLLQGSRSVRTPDMIVLVLMIIAMTMVVMILLITIIISIPTSFMGQHKLRVWALATQPTQAIIIRKSIFPPEQ